MLNSAVFDIRLIENSYYGKKISIVGRGENSHQLPEEGICRVNHLGKADIIFQSGDLDPYLKEDDTGSKTIFVGQCREFSEDWRQWGLKYNKLVIPFYNDAYAGKHPYGPENEWASRLCKELQTMPLTGIMAVAFFLQLPVSNIDIYGFDFYQNPDGSYPSRKHSHNLEVQMDWLMHQVQIDRRIKWWN